MTQRADLIVKKEQIADLQEVIALNRSVKPAEAEKKFKSVIRECSPADLQALADEISAALNSFLPKRRRSLEESLKQRPERDDQLAAAESEKASSLDGRCSGSVPRPSLGMGPLPPAKRASLPLPGRDMSPPLPGEKTSPPPKSKPGTSNGFTRAFAEIAQLNNSVQPAKAEEKYRRLLQSLDPASVVANEAALRQSAQAFLPKRRLALTELLGSRLREAKPGAGQSPGPVGADDADETRPAAPAVPTPPVPAPAVPAPPVRTLAAAPRGVSPTPLALSPKRSVRSLSASSELTYMNDKFSADLDTLSKGHIFQWATFYRDTLSEYFDGFLEYLYSAERPNPLLNLVRSALGLHAREIYGKGFAYVTAHNPSDSHYAITKSLTGLQRFLDLPLEFYSARLADAWENRGAMRLRQLCSAMLFGIVHGYASAKFDQAGSQVLPRFPRSWAHVLPFLTSEDLHELTTVLERGDFAEGIQDSVLPLVQALDVFLQKDSESAPLPALSQYVAGTRRLDVSLQMPPTANGSRLIEVQCYTSAQFVDRYLIEEAAARAVSAVVAPLRSDLRGLVASVERLSDIVVPTNGSGHEVAPQSRLLAALEEVVYENEVFFAEQAHQLQLRGRLPAGESISHQVQPCIPGQRPQTDAVVRAAQRRPAVVQRTPQR